MQEAKHTPGPWWPVMDSQKNWTVRTHRDNCENPQEEIGWDHGAYICMSIGDHTEERTSGNEEANARLIAAAPELLEALERLLPRAYNDQIPDHVHKRMSPDMFADVEMARAAIAKARAA